MGIPTHFQEFLPPNGMLVKKVDVIQPENIKPGSGNYLIPLEVICRWYAAGSIFDRLGSGKVKPEELGFPRGRKVEYGEPLPEPYIEVSTKLERVDRLLDRAEALEISHLSTEEYDEICETVLKIDEDIKREVEPRGLIHVDGKKEFAFDVDRQIMVIDVFGTADEDRFWDRAKYLDGEFVDLSKEYVRQHYRKIGYKDRLYGARDKKEAEPDIPPLPQEIVGQTSDIYVRLFEMITGEKFESSA